MYKVNISKCEILCDPTMIWNLHTYIHFIEEVSGRKLLSHKSEKYPSSLLAKFRLGMFPINIELGRYRRIPSALSGD